MLVLDASAAARLVSGIAVLAALGGLVAGCSTSRPSSSRPSGSPALASPAWSIVALGDSVPRGTSCGCRPYPALSADDLAASTGRRVAAVNDSVAGATTESVLAQLKNSTSAASRDVRSADAIEIEVGANDVGESKSCGTTVDCYAPQLAQLRETLAAIVSRTHELTSGRKVAVVLLDYWSVWLGGKYAAAQGHAYVTAAEQLTDRVNAVIKTTAADSGSYYVDLRAAFNGPNYAYDETHYLASDGDHPNAEGQERIGKAVEAVLDNALY